MSDRKSDSKSLPACAAEYVRRLLKKMRYRRKVRDDVEAELTAHFEDELKDCKSGQEKEQKARKLLSDFGDLKLLAILLRRAKKRCRPLWQTAAVRTLQAAGILLLLFIAYTIWFYSGKPVITTDYIAELNRTVCPAADETLNAAPYYKEAVEMLGKLSDDVSGLLRKEYNEVTPEQKELMEEWLNDNEETLELMITGTQKPYYWQRYKSGEGTEGMLSVLVPDLNEFRKLAYVLRWRVWLQVQHGRYKEAFDGVKTCYRLGSHLKAGAFLIEQLVGFTIERTAIETLIQVLDEHEITPKMLAELQQDFIQMIDVNYRIHLEAEKLSVLDEIQRSFTGGPGSDHIIPRRIDQLYSEVHIISNLSSSAGGTSLTIKRKQSRLQKFISTIRQDFFELVGHFHDAGRFTGKKGYLLFMHPNKQQTYSAAEELYEYLEKLTYKTPAQIRAESINTKKDTTEIIKGNVLLEMLEPAVVRVNELSHQHKANTQSLVAILALLRYRGNKGFYPENLQDLITTGYVKELPTDPFSDKPLVYKKTDDDFILYSVGPNFSDDGGEYGKDRNGNIRKWRDNGDTIFWPVTRNEN